MLHTAMCQDHASVPADSFQATRRTQTQDIHMFAYGYAHAMRDP